MLSETLTWIAIGAATITYIAHRHMAKPKQGVEVGSAPSAQKEVDPTRWRHDGTQPVAQRDGNRYIDDAYFAQELDLRGDLGM